MILLTAVCLEVPLRVYGQVDVASLERALGRGLERFDGSVLSQAKERLRDERMTADHVLGTV